jgi:hypothetical protein
MKKTGLFRDGGFSELKIAQNSDFWGTSGGFLAQNRQNPGDLRVFLNFL